MAIELKITYAIILYHGNSCETFVAGAEEGSE